MAPSKTVTLRSETAVSPVNPGQSLKASKALLAHIKKASKEQATKSDKKDLFADDDAPSAEQPIWLTLTTKRHIAETRALRPGKIALPHPLVDTESDVSVCLITAEPQRAYKNLVASDEFPAEWRKRVGRVIDVGKLKSKYKAYEQQRQLLAEHDVFLGDTRIINRLPGLLGKTFYKSTAKRPIPVEIQARQSKVDGKRVKRTKGPDSPVNACTPQQLAGEIERAAGAALIHLSPSTNTAVRVGFAGWEAEKVAANVDAVARGLVERFVPGKWKNVRSIYVKGADTTALPIWQTEELWVDEEKDVVADDSEEGKALLLAAASSKTENKPNVGKKRKSLGDDKDDEEKETISKSKKPSSKKQKKDVPAGKLLPESNDATLDKEIADRKAALKKQKKAAKAAVDV